MAGIGNWWVKSVPATPGEAVESSWYANFLRTDGRPLGGKLYLTTGRLLFCPHLIDSVLGGQPWAIDLAAIYSVERVRPGKTESYGGGSKERLRIVFEDDSEAIFVLSDLATATDAIDTAVANSLDNRE